MERAQRRIEINYARRMQAGKIYSAQSTHLPLKINMSGVIPPIFASSLIFVPSNFGPMAWEWERHGMAGVR